MVTSFITLPHGGKCKYRVNLPQNFNAAVNYCKNFITLAQVLFSSLKMFIKMMSENVGNKKSNDNKSFNNSCVFQKCTVDSINLYDNFSPLKLWVFALALRVMVVYNFCA
jgi:hypothetical protein